MNNSETKRICYRLSQALENLINQESCFSDEEREQIESAFFDILQEEFESADVESE